MHRPSLLPRLYLSGNKSTFNTGHQRSAHQSYPSPSAGSVSLHDGERERESQQCIKRSARPRLSCSPETHRTGHGPIARARIVRGPATHMSQSVIVTFCSIICTGGSPTCLAHSQSTTGLLQCSPTLHHTPITRRSLINLKYCSSGAYALPEPGLALKDSSLPAPPPLLRGSPSNDIVPGAQCPHRPIVPSQRTIRSPTCWLMACMHLLTLARRAELPLRSAFILLDLLFPLVNSLLLYSLVGVRMLLSTFSCCVRLSHSPSC